MRDNVTGAGNQQERPRIESISADTDWYLAGFADSEGSFYVSTINQSQSGLSNWLEGRLCSRSMSRNETILF
jgi:hypothetical protein